MENRTCERTVIEGSAYENEEYYVSNRETLVALNRKYSWLFKLRPVILAEFIARVMAPSENRRIIRTDEGMRLYLDPFSFMGRQILSKGTYEPDTIRVFRREVSEGQVVLDVGARLLGQASFLTVASIR